MPVTRTYCSIITLGRVGTWNLCRPIMHTQQCYFRKKHLLSYHAQGCGNNTSGKRYYIYKYVQYKQQFAVLPLHHIIQVGTRAASACKTKLQNSCNQCQIPLFLLAQAARADVACGNDRHCVISYCCTTAVTVVAVAVPAGVPPVPVGRR